MVKVGIVAPNNLLNKVIDTLYSLKAIQIEEYEKSEDFDIGHPLKRGEELSELVIKTKSIASNADINLSNKEFQREKLQEENIRNEINNIYDELKNSIETIDFYKKSLLAIKQKSYHVAFEGLKFDSARSNDENSLFFCGFVKRDIEKTVRATSETSFILTKDVDGARLVFILAPKAKKAEITAILKENNFLGIEKDEIRKLMPSVKTQFVDMHTRTEGLNRELVKEEKTLKTRLSQIKKESEQFILNANEILEEEHEKCEAPLKFAASKNTHVISGWVPEKRFEKVKETLEEVTENKIFVNLIPLKEKELGPVLLNNPRPAKSFQFLIDLFAMPQYFEVDPTILMFLTFPLFFGFMLGDIGYGFLTFIIFALLRMKFNKGAVSQILNILMLSSVGTIIFGFIFGEFFGEEFIPYLHIELPHLLSRAHQINELLAVAIIIGILHVLFGLILGFINTYHHHGLKHAVYEKVGWILLIPLVNWILVYFFKVVEGVYATILNYTIPPIPILIAISIIGVVLIFMGEGALGIIELPSLLSNILSYARLMAVGLASVQLALIINENVGIMFNQGGVMIIFGILLLIIGHLINIILGLFGPFIHSLRLHYVEFFKRFYTGGGKKFIPFGEKQKLN